MLVLWLLILASPALADEDDFDIDAYLYGPFKPDVKPYYEPPKAISRHPRPGCDSNGRAYEIITRWTGSAWEAYQHYCSESEPCRWQDAMSRTQASSWCSTLED